MFPFFGQRTRNQRKIDYSRLPATVSAEAVKNLTPADQARISVLAHSKGFISAREINQTLDGLKIPYEAWTALRRLEKEGLVECQRGNDDPSKGEVILDTFRITKKALNQ